MSPTSTSNISFREAVRREAELLIGKGYVPIRLGPRKKSPPTFLDNQTLKHEDNKLSPENINARLADQDFNLGCMLGAESMDLIDLDFDWPEARKIAGDTFHDFPSFGRPNARGSHRLAICPGMKSKKFQLPSSVTDPRLPGDHALCVMEIRAGGLTMMPPSVHPCGEQITWEKRSVPQTIHTDALMRKAGLAAFLSVCVRLWPMQGTRDETAMAMAGTLLAAGLDAPDADGWVCRVAELAGDEEWQKRGKSVATAAKIAADQAVTGLPTLVGLLGLPADCERTFRDWLRMKEGPGSRHSHGDHNSVDPSRPVDLARRLLKERFTSDDGRTLVFFKDEFHVFSQGYYRALEAVAVRKAIYEHLEPLTVMNPRSGPQPLAVTSRLVSNVEDALKSICLREKYSADPPCWINGAGPPPEELLVLRNGLFHLPTGMLIPHTPRFFSLSKIDIDYASDAPPPARWLQFLGELFPGDVQSVNTLQEMMGYFLVPDTGQQKAFMFVGPPRSGKGTLARVIEMLLGSVNYAGIKLSALGNHFGLQPLIPKLLAVVTDARLSSKTDRGNVVETILTITGQDTVTVDRKNTTAWEGKLKVRFFIHTNELPRIEDMSGAFASRFILLKTDVTFLGKEDLDLGEKLKGELPGILLWAIEGWRRLKSSGKFVQPESSAAFMRHFELMSSPVRGFVEERCVLDPEARVSKDALYEAYKAWQEAEGRTYHLDKQGFADKLYAAFPGVIKTQRPRYNGDRVYVFAGIRLDTSADQTGIPQDQARMDEENKALAEIRGSVPM